MFHLFSVLQTLLFSICLKMGDTKLQELNNLNKTIMKNVTNLRMKNAKDQINTRLPKLPDTFIHRRLNNEDVKNNLDTFSMVRRYGNPFSNYEFVPFLNNESVPISSVPNLRTSSFETDGQLTTDFVNEYDNEQILEVIQRQTILMEKLAEAMAIEHYALRSKHDFENLLSEIDSKKMNNKTSEAVKIASTTQQVKNKRSTVMTIVDETEVRTALKKDPLVMRILKMANMKRVQYIKAARKYYNS